MGSLTAKDWLTTLGNIATALLVAYFAVRLAFRRFYSEKRWEQKSDAYRRLFVALHQLKEHAWHELKLLEHSKTLPFGKEAEIQRAEVLKQLEEDMLSGIAELRLQLDIGTFVIDEAAVERLENLMLSLDEGVRIGKEQGVANYYSHRCEAVDECQVSLRKIAREDLAQGWK